MKAEMKAEKKEIEAFRSPIWFKGTMPSDWVTRFTVGNDPVWDTMLLPFDIEATQAHILGLVRAMNAVLRPLGVRSPLDTDRAREGVGLDWYCSAVRNAPGHSES